jgi:hypothetical protein
MSDPWPLGALPHSGDGTRAVLSARLAQQGSHTIALFGADSALRVGRAPASAAAGAAARAHDGLLTIDGHASLSRTVLLVSWLSAAGRWQLSNIASPGSLPQIVTVAPWAVDPRIGDEVLSGHSMLLPAAAGRDQIARVRARIIVAGQTVADVAIAAAAPVSSGAGTAGPITVLEHVNLLRLPDSWADVAELLYAPVLLDHGGTASVDEVADTLGISANSVRQRMKRMTEAVAHHAAALGQHDGVWQTTSPDVARFLERIGTLTVLRAGTSRHLVAARR